MLAKSAVAFPDKAYYGQLRLLYALTHGRQDQHAALLHHDGQIQSKSALLELRARGA